MIMTAPRPCTARAVLADLVTMTDCTADAQGRRRGALCERRRTKEATT